MKIKYIIVLLSLLTFVSGCQPAATPPASPSPAAPSQTSATPPPPTPTTPPPSPVSSPVPTTPPPTTSTPKPPATTSSPVAPAEQVSKLVDEAGDILDNTGAKTTGEPYMDIVEATLSLSGDKFIAQITLSGPPPTKIDDPNIFLEWDVLVDTDSNPATGWNFPLVCNDTGPDYLLRLGFKNSKYNSEGFDTATRKPVTVYHYIKGNTIELQFSAEAIGKPARFNYNIAVRKYGKSGDPGALVAFDKVPNQSHGTFPGA